MKLFTNKKWLYIAILFCGATLASVGIYKAYSPAANSATGSSNAAQQAGVTNSTNTMSADKAAGDGLLDKLQSLTIWGVNPFGPGKGASDEPAPIVNGEASLNRPHYEVRVWVYKNNRWGLCSGIAIAPQVILTAAHCVSEECKINVPGTTQQQCVPVPLKPSEFKIENSQDSINLSGNAGDIFRATIVNRYKIPAYIYDPSNDVGIIITNVPIYSKASALGKFSLSFVSDENKYAKLDDSANNEFSYKARIAGYGIESLYGQGGVGNLLEAYIETDPSSLLERFYIRNHSAIYSSSAYGSWAYDFDLAFIRKVSLASITVNHKPTIQIGDSGGGIRHHSPSNTKLDKRYFGLISSGSLTLDDLFNKPNSLLDTNYEFYAPIGVHRGWIDAVIKSAGTFVASGPKDLTEGNCYPNWPNSKPRNSKTNRCDDRTSDIQEQTDKGSENGVASNDSGKQCTEADLQRMVAWNRTNSTQGMTATARALWEKTSPELKAWETNLASLENRELHRLLNLPNYGGSSAMDSMRESQLRAMAKAYALANAGPKPQFVYTGPQGAQAIDVTDCVRNLAEQAARNPSFETPSCQSGYAAWRSAIITGGYAPRWSFDEKFAYLNGIVSHVAGAGPDYIMRRNAAGIREIALNFSPPITKETEAQFNTYTGSPMEFTFLVQYGRILGLSQCKSKINQNNYNYPDLMPINTGSNFYDWSFEMQIYWQNWNWSLGSSGGGAGNTGNTAGSNGTGPNNTGALVMGNAMPGTRYSDGSQSYSIEWFANGATRYGNCVVPSGVISAGSGAIGTYINNTASCRP